MLSCGDFAVVLRLLFWLVRLDILEAFSLFYIEEDI